MLCVICCVLCAMCCVLFVRGKALLATCEKVLDSCRRCATEHAVQYDSLDAAVGNLQDHYSGTKIAFEASQVSFSDGLAIDNHPINSGNKNIYTTSF
jgi:hypothetical protein